MNESTTIERDILFVYLLGKDKTGGESFGNNGNRFIEYHKNHSNQVTEQN